MTINILDQGFLNILHVTKRRTAKTKYYNESNIDITNLVCSKSYIDTLLQLHKLTSSSVIDRTNF